MQSKIQKAERELQARERKWMESEDSNFKRAASTGEVLETRSLPSSAVLLFASAMKALRIGASLLIEHGERNDSWSEL